MKTLCKLFSKDFVLYKEYKQEKSCDKKSFWFLLATNSSHCALVTSEEKNNQLYIRSGLYHYVSQVVHGNRACFSSPQISKMLRQINESLVLVHEEGLNKKESKKG